MKKLSVIALIAVIVLCLVGCNEKTPPTPAADLPPWETVSGSFVRDDFNQYNNAVLMMKYLGNDCTMIEFRLMEGSEEGDPADSLLLPAVLVVAADGVGRYESLPDSEDPYSIEIALSKDGQAATVTHTGELPISPDGVYNFIDAGLEVSDSSAITILEHLPAAATSLNHNNGEYVIDYPEGLVANWFYPVEARFKDSGAVLAKFIIAQDLSAVYRIDDDIEPILIFGSAVPMMAAETMPDLYEPETDGEDDPQWQAEPMPLVNVVLAEGLLLEPGQEGLISVEMPWALPYTLAVASSDSAVLTVEESGKVRALAAGEATLSGTVFVDDGARDFSFVVAVGSVLAEPMGDE